MSQYSDEDYDRYYNINRKQERKQSKKKNQIKTPKMSSKKIISTSDDYSMTPFEEEKYSNELQQKGYDDDDIDTFIANLNKKRNVQQKHKHKRNYGGSY